MIAVSGIITLLTDFGHREPFVGVMKGVILGIAPQAKIIDLSHLISPQDVASAAFWLARSAPYFPPNTVHVAVVDPGVGSARRALVARCGEQWFVAPDNGLLTHVLEPGAARVFSAEVPADASRTFHGRDVFAPLAAKLLARFESENELGSVIDDWNTLDLDVPVLSDGELVGKFVACDQFGNLISSLEAPTARTGSEHVVVRGPRGDIEIPLVSHYAEGAEGELIALVNSWNLIEVAVHRGSAVGATNLGVGDAIRLRTRR